MSVIWHNKSIGVVIGTFAAVPYIHLHLEIAKKFYPQVPILIHDDGSKQKSVLQALCQKYGVELYAAPKRRERWGVGDLCSFYEGLLFAERKNLNLLVKFSRRFIPLSNDWLGIIRLHEITRGKTFSHFCEHYGFGFRTECCGFDVKAWSTQIKQIKNEIDNYGGQLIEALVHEHARKVHNETNDLIYQKHYNSAPKHDGCDRYIMWPWMEEWRRTKSIRRLWHEPDTSLDYTRAAMLMGLSYTQQDFQDPNMGEGISG